MPLFSFYRCSFRVALIALTLSWPGPFSAHASELRTGANPPLHSFPGFWYTDLAEMKSSDEKYMSMALRLAAKARGRTSPNPLVGAMVVSKGRVIASGYHRKAGEPHAEAIALRKAGASAKGATLYVTLEPCSHKDKRTPPCCPLVIQSGVTRLVAATIDPGSPRFRQGH